jgi:hypothetical protein
MKCFHTQEDLGQYEEMSIFKDSKCLSFRKKSIKKRKRKSSEQLGLLFQVFKSSVDWDKEMMSELSKQTGLTEAQIYKWSWDQKKKIHFQDKLKTNKFLHLSEIFHNLPEAPTLRSPKDSSVCIDTNFLACREIVKPREIDLEMYGIQKKYRGSVETLQKVELGGFYEEIQGLTDYFK